MRTRQWRAKHWIATLWIMAALVLALGLLDLKRQQAIAAYVAEQGLHAALARPATRHRWDVPAFVRTEGLSLAGLDFTGDQWVATFAAPDDAALRVAVAPSHSFIIPVLNAEEDFTVRRIEYVAAYRR